MSNQREYERVSKSVKCEVHSDTMTFSSTLNISEGGLFISTPEPLDKDVPVSLYLYVNEDESIMVSGKVKWIRDDESDKEKAGMGIEFIEISDQDREFIKQYLQ